MKTRISTVFDKLKSRLREEDGAVSVDWVVLTAAIVGVAAASASSITDAVSTLGTSVGDQVSGKSADNGDSAD